MKTTAKPGLALKNLRLAKGWTLGEVGRRTGFSVPTLSRIENNRINLSYPKLARLADGLDVDISLLFAQGVEEQPVAATTGRRSITRAGEGRTISSEAYTHTYPASELLNKSFVPMFVDHHVRSMEEFGELIRHSGEEFSVVLSGAIILCTDLYEPLKLEVGDSVFFDSGMGHAYLAAAEGPCRTLSICTGGQRQIAAESADNKSIAVQKVENSIRPAVAAPRRRKAAAAR
ncbi:MAG: XRE family transcriptional regulator [Rhizomicrobium sp.]